MLLQVRFPKCYSAGFLPELCQGVCGSTLEDYCRAENLEYFQAQPYLCWRCVIVRHTLSCGVRRHFTGAIKRIKGAKKSAHTMELLGCSLDFLRAYLERQFKRGMTWENHGNAWHIDHIIPLARF